MAWVAVIGAGGAIAGGLIAKSGSSQSGTQTVTKQDQLDPRISSMLFGGSNGNGPTQGLLSQYQGMLGTPQNAGAALYGQAADNYVGQVAPYDMGASRDAAYRLMNGNTAAPQTSAAAIGNPQAYAKGNMVNAPAQNGIDLSGSYNSFIGGDRGGNTRLTSAIQGGIDQSTNQFRQMQGDATDNLMRNIMPSIRSNSVLSGQYGGSRQGIAEGNAISDFTKQQGQAMTQFGQNNTNAAVGAQANAYETDSNRALSATQGLGAQQYGVAQQDANTKNQAEFMNVNRVNDNQQQQAGYNQQANLANLSAQQSTNSLNSNNTQAGINGLNGLLGNAAGAAQNQDSYSLNQAGKVNGLLAPYLSANQSSTTSQPLYSSTAGNMVGGALGGAALAKQFGGLLGGSSTDYNALRNGTPGTDANLTFNPSTLPVNTGLLQNLNFYG